MTTNNDDLDQLGARIYGHGTAESAALGARVFGHSDEMDALGARVYGLVDRGTVSYEQSVEDGTGTGAATGTSERWRLDEVRRYNTASSDDGLDAIGARIAARHHDGGVVTVDNRGTLIGTPGLPGFDY